MSRYSKTVAIDLDGTLAFYGGWKGHDHIGAPRPGAVAFVRAVAARARVVIHTCRLTATGPDGKTRDVAPALAAVKAWLAQHGFPYDALWTGQGKPIADAYVDDRAVAITSNPLPGNFAAAMAHVEMLLEPVPLAA